MVDIPTIIVVATATTAADVMVVGVADFAVVIAVVVGYIVLTVPNTIVTTLLHTLYPMLLELLDCH